MGTHWKIQLLSVGRSEVRGPEVFWMSAWEEWLELNFLVAALRRDDEVVLINTGPPLELEELNKGWEAYIGDPRGALVVRPEERMTAHLARLGIEPAQVTRIILSPLQIYAVAGLNLFPRAEICISRPGWIEWIAPHRKRTHAERSAAIPDEILTGLVTTAWDRVRLVSDETEISPGLRVLETPAHHPESLTVMVDTAQGTVALTDSAFHYENIEQNRLLGIAENLEACHTAYARIRSGAQTFVPLYDGRVFVRHPGGVIG